MNTINSNTAPPARSGTVISADGTSINYLTTGRGPSVIAVPGVLSTASDYAAFAAALGETNTVHTIERRGRGLSGPQGDDYGIAKECEDVAAVQAATLSDLIFGHSYGGLIALEAVRAGNAFSKVAVYEPGVSVSGSIPMGWIWSYKQALAGGKPLEAFARFSVAAGPASARKTPLWLMKLVLRLVFRERERRRLFDLLPANLLEHQVVGRLDNAYEGYDQIAASVLVMRGGKSNLHWVPGATDALARTIPSVVVKAFAKLDHFGPDKSGSREVAETVAKFFSSRPG